MIHIDSLRKEYNGHAAVEGLSMMIPDGQLTVLLGPSGSGKTTVLRMLNRMIIPTSGTVRLDGEDLALRKPEDLRRSMGYVIQNTGLFPNMDVGRNIGAVPRLLGWEKKHIATRVEEMLDLVGLDPEKYCRKMPSQLSGGEAQRVGVARALAADPPIMLMDEPFGAVDPITRAHLQIELKDLHRRLGKTIVFVTHDIDEAVLLADRIALLRDGVLQQYGTPAELWRSPANGFVRDFFGRGLGLSIMKRHTLRDIALLPIVGVEGSTRIDRAATLNDALIALIESRCGSLLVEQDRQPIGSITFQGIVDALEREVR